MGKTSRLLPVGWLGVRIKILMVRIEFSPILGVISSVKPVLVLSHIVDEEVEHPFPYLIVLLSVREIDRNFFAKLDF